MFIISRQNPRESKGNVGHYQKTREFVEKMLKMATRGDGLEEVGVGGDGGEHGGELDLGAGGVRNPLQLRASELLWRRRRAGRAG